MKVEKVLDAVKKIMPLFAINKKENFIVFSLFSDGPEYFYLYYTHKGEIKIIYDKQSQIIKIEKGETVEEVAEKVKANILLTINEKFIKISEEIQILNSANSCKPEELNEICFLQIIKKDFPKTLNEYQQFIESLLDSVENYDIAFTLFEKIKSVYIKDIRDSMLLDFIENEKINKNARIAGLQWAISSGGISKNLYEVYTKIKNLGVENFNTSNLLIEPLEKCYLTFSGIKELKGFTAGKKRSDFRSRFPNLESVKDFTVLVHPKTGLGSGYLETIDFVCSLQIENLNIQYPEKEHDPYVVKISPEEQVEILKNRLGIRS
jgi:hypothetical protein